MLDRFTNLWIAAHMGGWPEDLGFLDGLVARHPNPHIRHQRDQVGDPRVWPLPPKPTKPCRSSPRSVGGFSSGSDIVVRRRTTCDRRS